MLIDYVLVYWPSEPAKKGIGKALLTERTVRVPNGGRLILNPFVLN